MDQQRSETEKHYLIRAIDGFRKRLIVIRPDFTIIAANYPPNGAQSSDIVGKKCFEIFHDRSFPCHHCAAKEAYEKAKPILRPKPDGLLSQGMLPCYYAYPIFSEDKIEFIVSMDFDLPTRDGLEERLQRSNAFLRNLILSSVDGVVAADKKGRIIIFNEMAANVFGYSAEEALTSLDIRDIYPDGGAYQVMAKLRSDEYGGQGKLKGFQTEILSKNGERIPISLNAAIVYEGNKEVATIGFFHDMREELRMKDELEKTQMQLLQAEKMASLGKLAAGVAHQLNNPLGGITLFTKLIMEDYELEDNMRDDLNRILRDAERCRDTVKELLEFSRQTQHFMRPNDINLAIQRTLFLLENQTLFHNIEVIRDLAPELPLVRSDVQQLNHVFMNIILNAAQAMKGNGKLRITTRFQEDSSTVRIEIADTGPGIPMEILPRIFEPFFTTKDQGEGTGLGLSLVYGIIENHEGSIRAENLPEGGSVFIIELPVGHSDNGGNTSGK